MDVLASSSGVEQPPFNPTLSISSYKSLSSNAVIVERVLTPSADDSVDVDLSGIDKNLSLTAQKIIERLNELLKAKLPEGIQSLKPEDVTPEQTAERIATQIASMYSAFAKQNSHLTPQETLERFMTLARKGVDQGYNDAYKILDELGAFQFEGVKSGVETTKRLLEEKLKALEAEKRKELGLDDPSLKKELEALVKDDLIAQGGVEIASGNVRFAEGVARS